ncbi:MAG: hypothetical protein ACR2KJ_14175 [Jatrophihabitans sp.]
MTTITTEAFGDELLRAVPEVGWPDHVDDEGVYLAFTHGILPMLDLLLDPDGPSPSPTDPDQTNQQRHRRQPFYLMTPPQPGSEQAEGLLTRLYSLIDDAAVRGDQTVRDAIYLELAESGYNRLTVDVLLARAGPATLALVAGP